MCDYIYVECTEVLLNSRNELLACMMNEGILRAIGAIIVSETDPVVLVCFLCLFSLSAFSLLFLNFGMKTKYRFLLNIHFIQHIQRVTSLLLSVFVEQYGLDKKDRDAITRDMIGNILRIIMVCLYAFYFC